MKKIRKKSLSLATRAIHGKECYPYTGPVSQPIYQTSTYRFENSQYPIRYARGDSDVYVYTRYHNPTVKNVEEKIALMEGGEEAALFTSGMAAISTAILSVVHAGDEIVSTQALYGGTYRFFRDILPHHNILIKYVPHDQLESLGSLITSKTKLVYLETPTNPTLNIVDVKRAVALVKKIERRLHIHIVTMIDNTFASIYNQDPFTLGVDVIVESATKYLGGHSDLLAGVVIGSKKFLRIVRHNAKYYGGCADPFMAYLLFRSLKTYELRLQRQNENAYTLVRALEKHSKVKRIFYPGIPSHPQHAIAKKQMSGFGGMVTIEVINGTRGAVTLCNNLHIAVNAMSLGSVETLVSIPVYSSHVNMSGEELKQQGVLPGMVRISVGVEGINDIIGDFRQALKKV
ncbi:MAG: PLP-dependent aspartate aminotransferase family protein [Bacteroidota bacterium]